MTFLESNTGLSGERLARWTPEPLWTGTVAHTGLRTPDRPARRQSLSCANLRKQIVASKGVAGNLIYVSHAYLT
jgi:hypothetical protein